MSSISNNQELKRTIDQICRDKGIERSTLILNLKEVIKSAAKRKYGLSDNFEVNFNEDTGEIEVFHFKEVVAEVTDPNTQITLEEAKKLDFESALGEELGVKLEAANFGRIAAQAAKQEIVQRMKDAERDLIFEEYHHRVGESVNGIIQRIDQVTYLLASVKSDSGDKAGAKELLESIRHRSQHFVDSRLFLASILIEENQREQALAMLTQARAQAAWAPQLVLAQATMYEESERFKEAKAIYVESLKAFPDVAEIRFRLGFVEDKLGDVQACIKSMRKAVELDPSHAGALDYLAYTWAVKGENLTEALSMALRADQLNPDNGYINDTLAWIYYAMGDLQKALPLLEKAAQLSGEDPVVLEHLGDALAKLGRKAEAKRAYARSLEKGHESPGSINEKLQKISD